MAIRNKTKRRVTILLGSLVVVGLLGAGAYVVRMHRFNTWLQQCRTDGIAACKAGNYQEALIDLSHYLQRYPADADSLYYFAEARWHVESPDGKHLAEASRLLVRLLDLQPDNLQARHTLLDLYTKIGFNTEALAQAEMLLGRNPEDTVALRAKGMALARLHRWEEALGVCQQYNQACPLDIEAQILTLEIMAQHKLPAEQVVARAARLLAAHPNDPRFELLQGEAYAVAGDTEKSLPWIRKAASRDLPDADFVLLLSGQLNRLNLFAESLQVLQRAAQGQPEVKIQQALMARLWEQQRWQDVVDRLSGLDPKARQSDAHLLAFRAMSLIRLGRREEATPILDALAGRKNELLAQAWAKVIPVAVLAEKPDFRKLAQATQEALQLNAGNACFRFFAGEAYAGLGETEVAIEQWKAAHRLAPTWPEPLLRLARAYVATLRVPEAIQAAQSARLRAPENAVVLGTAASVFAAATSSKDTQANQELLKMVDQVQRLSPGEEQTLTLRVALLARNGKRDQAVAALQALLDNPSAISEQTLFGLASVSHEAQLGLEQACLAASEKRHGLSAELAYARALAHLRDKQPEEGLKLLEAAYKAPHVGDDVSWRLAMARYRELIQDPRAKEAWIALADGQPENVLVQRAALGAKSVQSEAAFVDRVIERLRTEIGEQGISWRLARAQWLMLGNPDQKQVAQAASMLTEVTRLAPDLPDPRAMLAVCMEKLGNTSGAVEQLAIVAELRPGVPAVLLDLAGLLQIKGEPEQARSYLDQVAQIRTITPSERRAAAKLLAQMGDSASALKLLQGGQGQDAGQQSADLLLAVLYRQQNEPAKAEQVLKKLLAEANTPASQPAAIQFAVDFYLSQNRPADAERAVGLLRDVPGNPAISHLIRADYQMRTNHPEEALKEYRAATAVAPSNPQAWRSLLVFHLSRGAKDEVLAAAEEAAKAIPDNPVLSQFQKNSQLVSEFAGSELGRPLLVSLLQQPGDGEAVLEALKLLSAAGKNQEPAGQLASQLRQLADRNVKALAVQTLAAEIYLRVGKFEDAATLASRAMQTFPNAPEPARLAASALAAEERWAEARGAAERWHERSSDSPLAADLMIATADLGLGQPQSAIQHLRPYMEASRATPETYLPVIAVWARAQVMARQVEQAEKFLTPLIARNAQWRSLWMGLATQGISDASVAAGWLKRVSSCIPEPALDERMGLVQSWQQLAQRWHEAQFKQTAGELLGRLMADARASTKVTGNQMQFVGVLNEAQGDLPAAEAAYRSAVKLDGNLAVAKNNLAMLIVQRDGDLAEAADLVSAAITADAKVPNFYDTLAHIQAKRRLFDQCVQSLKKALELQPDSAIYRINLAQALLDSGQLAQAKSTLAQVESQLAAGAALSDDASKTLKLLRQRLGANSVQ